MSLSPSATAAMILPHLPFRLLALIASAAISGAGSMASAEQPPVAPAPDELKTVPRPLVKPQVIYHLPRTPAYVDTLHSQAKRESNSLPIDSSMPTSLQISRAAANAAAAQAEQGPSPSPSDKQNAAPPAEGPRRELKQPKIRVQRHFAPPRRGSGNSHGRSHKK